MYVYYDREYCKVADLHSVLFMSEFGGLVVAGFAKQCGYVMAKDLSILKVGKRVLDTGFPG